MQADVWFTQAANGKTPLLITLRRNVPHTFSVWTSGPQSRGIDANAATGPPSSRGGHERKRRAPQL